MEKYSVDANFASVSLDAGSTDHASKRHLDNEQTEIPDSITDVVLTLQETLAGIWKNFIEHMPYLIAGVLALFLAMFALNVEKAFLSNRQKH